MMMPERTRSHHELLHGDRCRLAVVEIETGEHWSCEALDFVSQTAAAKAGEAPPVLRRSAHLAWSRRWLRMLSVACGEAFASSLLDAPDVAPPGTEGPHLTWLTCSGTCEWHT